MSNLENLVTKIVADSKQKAVGVTDEANAQAKKIIDECIADANREKEDILNAAKADAQKTKDLILTKKKIEIRDSKLSAKQALIEKVFAMSADKLNQLSLPEYEAFLVSYLSKIALTGDEVLMIPKRYERLNMNTLNEKLSQSGKPIKLTMEQGDVQGGFVLRKGGALDDNTFEALMEYYRDDLEKIVSDSLF